jgi:hypothetical protein
MTDKELLELAAKAAGITMAPHAFMHKYGCSMLCEDGTYFNPLTDDGDCFRMETALGMAPAWYRDGVGVIHKDGRASPIVGFYTDHNGDKDKARRYASTRAAAEIGKQKE